MQPSDGLPTRASHADRARAFFQACPFAYDVVKAVRTALQANIPKYNDLQLQPAELTFFLGVSGSSCTLWHTDSEEHDKRWFWS